MPTTWPERPGARPEDRIPTDPAAGRFRCAVHGTSADLARLSEAPVESATQEEAEEYGAFVHNYQTYWPRYLDPIGVELSLQPDRVRLASCILPLIESSSYLELKGIAGGEPRRLLYGRQALEHLGAIFSIKLAPFDGYKSDLSHIEDPQLREMVRSARTGIENWLPWDTTRDVLSWIGPEAGMILLDTDADGLDRLSNSVGAARIAVVDPDLAAHLLQRIAKFSPTLFEPAQVDALPTGVRLRLQGRAALSELECLLTADSLVFVWGQPELRQPFVETLLALMPTAGTAADTTPCNAFFGLHLAALPKARKVTLRAAEQAHAEHCLRNLARLEDLGAFEAFAADTPQQVLARTRSVPALKCPDGGRYERVAGWVRCSVHGTLGRPIRPEIPPQDAPLRRVLDELGWVGASLTFTPEGIRTSVELPTLAGR